MRGIITAIVLALSASTANAEAQTQCFTSHCYLWHFKPYDATKHAQQFPRVHRLHRPPKTLAYQACEQGHWIQEVLNDGHFIKLEDGELWEVDELDVITSALWLSISDVIVCDHRIININDNETVNAHPLN
jgi:hypothetical protein